MEISDDIIFKIESILDGFNDIRKLFSKTMYTNVENLNKTINLFVTLIDNLEIVDDKNIRFYLERTGDYIVDLIEIINKGNINHYDAKNNIDQCIKYMNHLKIQAINKNKKNIIVIGITQYSQYLNEVIDYNKVNVLAYVNLDEEIKIGLETEVIINFNEINKFEVDFFLLMDANKEMNGLDSTKKIEYGKYLNEVSFQSPEFSMRYCDFVESKKDYEGIITGISYTALAIDTNMLMKKFANLANPSQDLFYDFEMFKYGLEQSENVRNIKYSIIGLCLYSFNYDLSISKSNRFRTIYYQPVVERMHNFIYKEEYEEFFNDFNKKASYIFNKDYHLIIFNKFKARFKEVIEYGRNKEFDSKNLTSEEVSDILDNMNREFNKNYPETRIENINIFNEYLQLLKDNDIKTIVVIPPLSRFHEKYVSAKMMEDTLEIISFWKKKYEFTFIDFSENKIFKDEHFTDGTHLNSRGSEIFTDIINQYLG